MEKIKIVSNKNCVYAWMAPCSIHHLCSDLNVCGQALAVRMVQSGIDEYAQSFCAADVMARTSHSAARQMQRQDGKALRLVERVNVGAVAQENSIEM